ncbi:MAG: SDR family NAD(P)-dependent oxidoreductase [Candidatus Obscuribacter sp.]|nr:SDR family NAD(P)-dependent oxidoreductase [Candidatus Obscuribacter sp.]
MDLDLKGKTAVVTGASYGLGFACAQALAQEGVDVVICSRDKQKITAAADSIKASTKAKVLGVKADLTSKDDLHNLVSEAQSFLGHIDILVVSTGHPPTLPFTQATDEHWQVGNDYGLAATYCIVQTGPTWYAGTKVRPHYLHRLHIWIGSRKNLSSAKHAAHRSQRSLQMHRL